MLWFVFALLTAIFASLRDLVSKQALQRIGDEYIVTWSSRFLALPFFLPLLLYQFFQQPPTWDAPLASTIFVVLVLQVVSNILYFRAIKLSDLSITVPMISFTPLFLLVTSPLIVGEFPGQWDIVGMLLIVGGSYILRINNRHKGYLAPLQALFRENGPRFMLAVAVFWSFLSTLNKVGVQQSSPIFWAALNSTVLAAAMTPIMLYKSQNNLKLIPQNIAYLFTIGLFQGVTVLCFMQAVKLTLVAEVVSVKRTSILFSALFGHIFLQEPGIKERMTGATIMLVGVILITLL